MFDVARTGTVADKEEVEYYNLLVFGHLGEKVRCLMSILMQYMDIPAVVECILPISSPS
jgi:hypothetical protein